MSETKSRAHSQVDRLIEIIQPMIAPLGYEVAQVEIQMHRGKTLRVFIDRLNPEAGQPIGVEDCATVSRTLDEPLDATPEIEAIFHGSYELEVSSPGIDRPLRQAKDFERFSGKQARIHVYRPLTAEEIGDAGYQQKNPKQKNFLGVLKGFQGGRVLMALSKNDGTSGKKAKKAGRGTEKEALAEVTIPLELISKANLEPALDFDSGEAYEI